MERPLLLVAIVAGLLMLGYLIVASFPDCEYETGETNLACVHSDGSGDVILNLGFGKLYVGVDR